MKITQLRDKDKTTALTTMDMETWIGKTRTETKTQPVSAFREVLRYSLPDSRCYEADKLPKILPAAEFRRAEGGKQMKSYNGIVELTVGPLSGGPEITLVKQLAWEQPQTHCVFTGSSGRSVKIWAKFTRPDNSLPQKREEAEIFHAHAYRLAVKCYQPQIPFSILPKEPSLEQYSRLSYDPELMYRPDSVPFYLSQPSGMPEELTYREAVRSEKSPLTRAVPGYDTERAVFMLFEAALRKTHEEIYEAEDEGAPERGEDFQAMVTQLAVNCFHSGIPEEETVKRTIFHYYLRRQEVLIRQLVKNVYEEQKRVRKEEQLRERTVPVTPDRGVYEQALRIPLQHPSGRSGIPRAELIPFLLQSYQQTGAEQYRTRCASRGYSAMGQGHKPIYLLQPHPCIQSVGRFPLPSPRLGRQRPYPRTGANRSLRKQALGRLVSPLVSQHGHALAWDR